MKNSFLLSMTVLLAAVLVPNTGYAQESWSDSIKVSGDFRIRYESIDEEGREDIRRGRFRGRLGLTADLNDKLRAVVRIATGRGNPTSTNQTIGEGFSPEDLSLDRAYLDWAPNETTRVFFGKMRNPFRRVGNHALLWDGDWNPEGAAVNYQRGGFSGTAGLMMIDARSSADDSLLTALQASYAFEISDGVNLTAGAGYFGFSNTVGNRPFHNGRPRGNTVDVSDNLVLDYDQFEFFAELDMRIGEFPFTVFADFVQNSSAQLQDRGYAFGAVVGNAGKPGNWQASWAYQELQADAIIGTYTDADLGGGGTDNKGHVFRSAYRPANNWALAAALFINDRGRFAGDPREYNRLQLDLQYQF